MKKIFSLLLLAATALSLSAGAYADAAPSPSSDAQGDVAKMYRVKHELKFDLQGKSAILDGKSITADKPILKAGRVYVPLRTLRQSGAANAVTWDPAKRQVHVVMNQEVLPPFSDLIFRIGSEKIYQADGSAIGDEKIPAPFISNGVSFVPVRALTFLGMAVSTVKDTVSWNWSDKFIEILKPEWETAQDSTTFTMLYQKDMYIPQYLYPLGSSGWGGETGNVTEKDISLDGRLYNRMQFTANLRPGPNPLMLTAVSAGSKVITVKQTVSDPSSIPVKIQEPDGTDNISFTKPISGYVKAKAGEKVDVSGDILQQNDLFDKLTVSVQRYEPSSKDRYQVFKDIKRFELPIKDQKFSGSFTLSEKGSYLITVLSPSYIPFPEHGPSMTQWAEFVVDVE